MSSNADVLAAILQAALSIDAKVSALDAKVSALDAKVSALDVKVTAQGARLEGVESSVRMLDSSVRVLNAASANERVRMNNSMKANVALLQPFSNDRDGNPWPAAVRQPPTLLDLAVAGNENKPGLSEKPAWNKACSKAFLKAAVVGYDEDGTDGEGEFGDKARTVRIKVIQAVGGNVASVFSSQYIFT
jgi:hypothetical protein